VGALWFDDMQNHFLMCAAMSQAKDLSGRRDDAGERAARVVYICESWPRKLRAACEKLVEPGGIEPPTSCVQGRRSPS
jgi:hypothetical protein